MNTTKMNAKRTNESKKGLENCIRRAHEMILHYGNKTDESSISIVKQAMKNLGDAEALLKKITDRELEQELAAVDTYLPRRV